MRTCMRGGLGTTATARENQRRSRYVGSPPSGSPGSTRSRPKLSSLLVSVLHERDGIDEIEHVTDRARGQRAGLAERVQHAPLRASMWKSAGTTRSTSRPSRADTAGASPSRTTADCAPAPTCSRARSGRSPAAAASAASGARQRRLAQLRVRSAPTGACVGRRPLRHRLRHERRVLVDLRHARGLGRRHEVDLRELHVGALRQDARRARAPVRGRLAIERVLLVGEPRWVALAAGEPPRGVLEAAP